MKSSPVHSVDLQPSCRHHFLHRFLYLGKKSFQEFDMTRRMKWAFGLAVALLCMLCMLGPGSLARKGRSEHGNDVIQRKTAAGATGERTNSKNRIRSKGESGIYSHPPEWHLAHWPDKKQELQVYDGPFEEGVHVWKSDDGTILGEIEYRDGQPFQGTLYDSLAASGFRTLRHYENGEVIDTMAIAFFDGQWELLLIERDKKVIYQRK